MQTLPDSIKKVLRTEEELENALMSSEENENIPDDNVTTIQDDPSSLINPVEEISIQQNVCTNVNICCICKKGEFWSTYLLYKCGKIVHTICADSTLSTEEGFGSGMYPLCAKRINK